MVTLQQGMTISSFESVHRYWNTAYNVWAVQLLPGQYYVTTRDEIIVTVLGSCIAACIRDTVLGIAGINHFMLPVGRSEDLRNYPSQHLTAAARYGNYAMELLINTILKQGGERKNLEVKIFGGGRILNGVTDIGQLNITFVREYIRTEGLKLVAEDVGDRYPRKIVYFPVNGRVRMKKLRSLQSHLVMQRERHYLHHLVNKPIAGEIELF